jgi:hypothetical protein
LFIRNCTNALNKFTLTISSCVQLLGSDDLQMFAPIDRLQRAQHRHRFLPRKIEAAARVESLVAAVICHFLAVYYRESTGPRHLCHFFAIYDRESTAPAFSTTSLPSTIGNRQPDLLCHFLACRLRPGIDGCAHVLCHFLVVYDREYTGPCLLCLPLRWREGMRTSDLCSVLLKGH